MKNLKVTVDGQVFEVEVEALDSAEESSSPAASSGPPAGDGEDVPSPLAGKVVEVEVSVGDHVSEGETLLVLEAMKMNTLVSAPKSGSVVAIHVAAGDMVEEGQGLVSVG